MNAKFAIRKIMEAQNVGVNELARKMDKSSRLISDRLRQENISIKKLQEILRILDYKIILVPGNRQLREGEYDISKAVDDK